MMRAMTWCGFWGLLALSAVAGARDEGAERRSRDAAEAVREGDVSQWLQYYQRERQMAPPASQPARLPEPVPEAKAEQTAPKR